MKRSWIGAGLLAVLLAMGLLVTYFMAKIHEPIARDLISAGEYAMAGDWDQAEQLYNRASDSWEQTEVFRACFADHNPMEEVDACFAQGTVYLRMKEETAFAAACGETAKKTQAMGDAHSLVWKNLF